MPNNNKTIILVCAVVVTLFAFLPPAGAAQIDTSSPAFAEIAGQTSIPVGAAEFCRTHREDCSPNSAVVDAVELTEGLWTQLLEVNADVNGTVVPVTDEQLYQVAEYWTYPAGYGDCEDIALEKRRELIAGGWDPSTLLMAVVREANGNGHAVLMVRTDRGDLVLDNQDGMIMVWTETRYQFVKRQSQANPGQWVDIVDHRATIVAASN
jgi:predicted transglutaminase-like cysteine proteinase